MRVRKIMLGFLVAVVTAAASSAASANSVIFAGTGTGPDGDIVSGNAMFTVTNNQIQVILTNTTATTHSAGDLFTQIAFTISGGKTVTSEIAASAADVISFPTKGSSSFTDLGAKNLLAIGEWPLVAPNTLTWNGSSGPDYGILGAGPYTSANNSIEGNSPHNPFIVQTASFTLGGASILATDTISNVRFYFGTSPSLSFTVPTGTPNGGSPPPVSPLPNSFWSGISLLGALCCGGALRKKFAH
jgi:hypothetical protein